MSSTHNLKCTHCNKQFKSKYENMKLCFDCHALREKAFNEYSYLQSEISRQRRYIKELTAKPYDLPEYITAELLLILDSSDATKNQWLTQWIREHIGEGRLIPDDAKPTPKLF